CLQTKSSPRTF
nr:immunoglobulin light chain junction region [Macaca mulatta]MOX26545.1 immunoglobulin light chain junction region [Macaca mulatta]